MTQFGSVFISYSHQDQEWLDRIKTYLKPIENAGALTIWDDKHIAPGSLWRTEIQQALTSARVGLLLVSPDFLASDFIMKEELPVLIDRTTLIWVPLRACLYQFTPLRDIQAAHDPKHPLNSLRPAQQDAAIMAICNRVIEAAQQAATSAPASPSHPVPAPTATTTSSGGTTPMSSFQETKRATLQRRLTLLKAEWDAINEQIDSTLSSGDRVRLERQANTREAEIQQVEADLVQLGKAATAPPAPQSAASTTGTTDAASPGGAKLTQAERMALVSTLLACPSLNSRTGRDTVLQQVDPQIVNQTARMERADMDILQIVTTCLNYPNGLAQLIRAIRFFEGNSISMNAVDAWLAQHLPDVQQATACG